MSRLPSDFGSLKLEDEPLKINEVLTHFLGHSDFPSIPDLTVEEFSFTVRPRSKLYHGEIKLSANWNLTDKFSLRGVYFRMYHDAGEGDTSFEANGVFEIAEVPVYVSANYVSNGRGWTFSGGTFDDEEIEIGEWLAGVWALWAPTRIPTLPPALKDLVLLNLGVRFNTTTGDYSFQGTARFPIDGKTKSDTDAETRSNAELTVQVDREGDSATFRGMLSLFQRDFEVVYDSSGLLVASYDGTAAEPVDLKQFISEISETLGSSIASGIKINLSHAQLAYSSGVNKKFLFAVDLDAGIQLSNLPLVGFLFDRDQTLNVVFQFLAVNRAFEAAEIQSINALAAPEMTTIPAKRIGGARPEDPDFRLEVAVQFGGETHPVSLPLTTDVRSTPASNRMPVAASASKPVYWIKIDKALGPFHFQRLGIGTDGSNLAFLMDASLETAGLTITLDGLEARCSFQDLSKGTYHPAFGLSGLGISFRSGDLEIGGALVQRPGATDAFDGALVIRYKRLGIEAVGSYETVAGSPSLFVYALIDYPLGGPAFFFVEGGAVGFGYNRSFTMPPIAQVAEFPLVKQATAARASRLTPLELADQLKPYIAPVAGQYFITAGIRFSSYKTIKGFVLLTVLFGDHFEIDVLGKATLTAPPDADSSKALISATLLLLGRFLPEDGLLMVIAELGQDARLFAPNCHLTGGFALYCWFDGEKKGDFVLTMGGYHKSFAAPDYYPKVPRLGMNWQVDRNLSLKAEAYFALTPSALMAGGKLEANWQSGDLHAWFRAEVDFLIAWQPFHYDGHAYVALGARYRFNFFGQHEISAELTAELDVWGPPFSGRARVQWNLISFEVAFGDKERRTPPALDWARFRKAFLPEGNLFTVTAEGGKVARGNGSRNPNSADLGCLNPRNLCIAVRSPMPVKVTGNFLLEHALESAPGASVKEPELGIAPMNRTKSQWKSTVSVIVVREKAGSFTDDKTTQFQATRIRNNVPVSLWGQTMEPQDRKKDEPQLLKDAICGYEIRPSKPAKSATDPQPFTVTPQGRAIPLNKPQPAKGIGWRVSSDLAVEITAGLDVQKKRRELLTELLPDTDVNWGSVTVASWRGSPRIVTSVG